jgi:hypothetical protein
MKQPSQELVDAFFLWYRADRHSQNEDHYAGQVTGEVLRSLSREQLTEFFVQFARDGGKVQSGGSRTAPLFRKTVEAKYKDFRNLVLEPFSEGFDELSWLDRTKEFPGFGQGLATIYLNRVDKKRFAIINNKAVEAMSLFGVEVPVALGMRFEAVRDAERQLIEWFPEFDNFYRADALNHFLISEEVGQPWADELRGDADKGGLSSIEAPGDTLFGKQAFELLLSQAPSFSRGLSRSPSPPRRSIGSGFFWVRQASPWRRCSARCATGCANSDTSKDATSSSSACMRMAT